MRQAIKVPVLAESVSSATVLEWRVAVGQSVQQDQILFEIETDKIVMEIPSPVSGHLAEILAPASTEVLAEQVVGWIETEASATTPPAVTVGPATASPKPVAGMIETEASVVNPPVAPVSEVPQKAAVVQAVDARTEQRVPMTRLRVRIAERLVLAQSTAAILTTFNEVDMSSLLAFRHQKQDEFQKIHGVKLGMTSFFVKACVRALKEFPVLNASVDGTDVLYHSYYDIGVAVSSSRGLVVPVLRDVDKLSMVDIEKQIADFAKRAELGTLTLGELQGGTFTVSNGGVFGSMFSTPIINPPQSAILGIHATQDRPVVVQGEIVIRPMNYFALSYDHRLIDGREAVLGLVTIKNALEKPETLMELI
jgi:2-oxoglutarate dehydrogenase E2 component (dihydrolipoamide succinyltransferase)